MTPHLSPEQHSTPSGSEATVPAVVRAQPIGLRARTFVAQGGDPADREVGDAGRGIQRSGAGSTPAAQPAAIGHPTYSVTKAAVPESVEEARRLVRQAMSAWGLGEYSDTAALLISELVTNAITHTPSRSIRVVVARPAPSLVRLAVVDRAPHRVPMLRPAAAGAENGRGLHLIDAFAYRWGYDLLGSHPTRGPWGKRCWAELSVEDVR
ncbi:ATP-binding protein [Streptomyces turgidiscabies]|uniref:Anti-sigma regulatory factor (Ser/Thr protein kinase) n=1 Tax=Streptomyces turgidiscabies TaxID=85558 RepID=A0ABU0RHK8_9ACTN|nr:ATP-binding protein [Streptomyces turgidiscabies]MDQ0931465.1 anti-sigma regulatory factor (Ser/Thr protein kinase) [Streptomyces turgidiscabies]